MGRDYKKKVFSYLYIYLLIHLGTFNLLLFFLCSGETPVLTAEKCHLTMVTSLYLWKHICATFYAAQMPTYNSLEIITFPTIFIGEYKF